MINTEGYYPLDYPQLFPTFAKFSQKLAVKKRKHMMMNEWTPIGTFKLLRIF